MYIPHYQGKIMMQQIKSVLFLSLMSALFLGAGWLFGGTSGLTVAFILALLFNGFMYFFSDKVILSVQRAQPLDPHAYRWIYQTVQELTREMNIPMPKLWLVSNPVPNAFATGRNASHSSVALTTGILEILDKKELRGVLAHELSHVKNRDILMTSIAATLATAIGYIAQVARLSSMYESDRSRRNPLAIIVMIIFMPILASLLQLGLSRSREYLADKTGAEECKDPLSLARALEKLAQETSYMRIIPTSRQISLASIGIINSLHGKFIRNLFSSHPPVEDRIARLEAMARQSFEK